MERFEKMPTEPGRPPRLPEGDRDRVSTAEALYHGIFAAAADAILLADEQQRYVDANPAAEDLLGYSRDEILARRIEDIVAAGPDWTATEFQRFVETGRWQGELELRRKDGARIQVEARASRIELPGGQVFLSILRDIRERRENEAERERLLRERSALLESTGEGIYGIDLFGKCIFVNPAAARMVGWEPNDLLGRPLHAILHHHRLDGTEYPADECPILGSIRTGRGCRIDDEVIFRKDGEAVPVEYSSNPIIDEGRIIGAVVTFSDISLRRQAEIQQRDETRLLETLNQVGRSLSAELDLESLLQAVTNATTALTGAQFGAFFFNPTVEEGEAYILYSLAGAPHPAFEQFPLTRNSDLFEPTFRGEGIIRLDDVTQDPRSGRDAPSDSLPPGHLPVRSYLAVPVAGRTGEVLGGLFFGHAEPGIFTERAERIAAGIAAQAAIAIDNARLFRSAQDAIRARDQFLSVAAHELKTPLTSLRASAQFMLYRYERDGGYDPAALRMALQTIDRQSARLSRLVDQLLDTSWLESGHLGLERAPADLCTLVQDVVQGFREQAPRRTIRVRYPARLIGSFDAGRIEQVLVNLLDNALKFGPPDQPIDVEVGESRGDQLCFSVRDRGPGIPADLRARLFDRDQLFEAGNHQAGLGIGLYLSRRIVELHGGTIDVESPDGGGARFIVQFPAGN